LIAPADPEDLARGVAIVRAVSRVEPAFNRRPLTWADFLDLCQRQSINVTEHEHGPDGRTFRPDVRGRISLRRGLTETYRTFVAWHEIGHWVLHPHGSSYYFERQELDLVEQEATYVACLSVQPWGNPPAVTTLTTRLSGDWRKLPLPILTVRLGPRTRRRAYRFQRCV
jgi:hypothetical protein